MQLGFGLEVPQTMDELCHPQRMALLVYDMQVGILPQIAESKQITTRVARALSAAREAGVRVFFTRHMTLPNEVAGIGQLRMRMAWQRVSDVTKVKSSFPSDSPQFQLVPELKPLASEAVLDKTAMSAFVGTPFELALHGCGVSVLAIVGVAMEVGIEPTVRHAADLGFIPVVVADACGAGNQEAAQRSVASLKYAGDSVFTDTDSLCAVLGKATRASPAR
jgi:nicotinamidase-related amidase